MNAFNGRTHLIKIEGQNQEEHSWPCHFIAKTMWKWGASYSLWRDHRRWWQLSRSLPWPLTLLAYIISQVHLLSDSFLWMSLECRGIVVIFPQIDISVDILLINIVETVHHLQTKSSQLSLVDIMFILMLNAFKIWWKISYLLIEVTSVFFVK